MTTTGTASRLLRVLAVAVAVTIAAWLVVSAQRRANPPETAEAPASAGEPGNAPAQASAPADGQQPTAARRTRRTVIRAHLESCALLVPSVATAKAPVAVLPPPQPVRRDQ